MSTCILASENDTMNNYVHCTSYYTNKKQDRLAYQKEYNESHHDEYLEYQKKYYKTNRKTLQEKREARYQRMVARTIALNDRLERDY